MARLKAVLILDEHRYPEQMAYISERAQILLEQGNYLWASITEAHVTRFIEQGIVVQVDENADFIETPAVRFNPLEVVPAPAPELRIDEPTGDAMASYIVQFIAPLDMAWLDEIVELGGVLLQELPIHAAVFQMTREQAAASLALDTVQWVGLYHPGYAVASVLGGREDFYPVNQLNQLTAARIAQHDGEYAIHPFDAVDTLSIVTALADVGIVVPDEAQDDVPIIVDADASNITPMLRIAGIYTVQPFVQAQTRNSRAGIITGIEEVRSFGVTDFLINLDGTGEIVGVVDSGIDDTHPDFGTNPATPPATRIIHLGNVRDFAVPTTVPTTERNLAEMHGVHVTGTIAGNGAAPIASGSQIRGVAPNSQIVFHAVRSATSGSFPSLSRLIRGIGVAHDRGAHVHNNSWGGEYLDGVHRYDATSRRIDQWAFTHPDSLVLFAVGNQNLGGTSMGPEAAAKNVIAVGASENITNVEGNIVAPAVMDTDSDDADEIWRDSSRGTVVNSGGRIRPDIVAPGTNVISVGQRTLLPETGSALPKSADPAFYAVYSGSSMATPQVSGAAILTRQFLRTRFGQLRRPLQFNGVPIPAAPPQPQFGMRPTIARRTNDFVVMWELPDVPANARTVQATTTSFDLQPTRNVLAVIAAPYAARPMIQISAQADAVMLIHAATGNELHLRRLKADLTPDTNFGTAGLVSVASNLTTTTTKPPCISVVADAVAVAWVDSSNDLHFQRFNATTGAKIDTNPLNLGSALSTTQHPYIVHTGTHFAVMWTQVTGTDHNLVLRRIAANGALLTQQTIATTIILRYGFAWDARRNGFIVVYAENEDLFVRFATADGSPLGTANRIVNLVALTDTDDILVTPRTQGGYYLLWQDNSQNNATVFSSDIYATILAPNGTINPIIDQDSTAGNRRVLRLTDTNRSAHGFAAMASANGITVIWQSDDEINSDQLGIYGLNITPQGKFAAQVDPRTPIIHSAQYINQTLHTLANPDDDRFRDRVSLVCTGGHEYMLRLLPDPVLLFSMLWQLVQTDADSRKVSSFGINGARGLNMQMIYALFDLHWTGSQGLLAAVIVGGLQDTQLRLWDAEGAPVATFGTNGVVDIADPNPLTNVITPQVTHYITGVNMRVAAVYGTTDDRVRYVVVNNTGGSVVAPRDLLTDVAGTARRKWFHTVQSENRHIAAWHRVEGTDTHIFVNRFRWTGARIGGDVRITDGISGESINATLSPRPTGLRSNQREYGIVYQHRANNTVPWEVHFSRLTRTARTMNRTPTGFPNLDTSDVQVVFPGVSMSDSGTTWHVDHSAIEPQIISTYYDEDWNYTPSPGDNLPDWSPGYGLAFLGVAPDDKQTLYFTALDENGRRLRPITITTPPTQVPIVQISDDDADVIDFELAWNGRTFRLYWTEKVGTAVKHRHTAITRYGVRNVHSIPSAALLRALLINGATNLQGAALPQLGANTAVDGYGWGRLNLRQSLAPIPPVTMHIRDDNALASGQRARYTFQIPPNTVLLRCTLIWLDPPGNRLVNTLQLRMQAPGQANIYLGNTWDIAGGNPDLSLLVPPATAQVINENTQQIVLNNPTPGEYTVEVVATINASNTFNQSGLQHYALAFVGSGAEIRMTNPRTPLPNRVY